MCISLFYSKYKSNLFFCIISSLYFSITIYFKTNLCDFYFVYFLVFLIFIYSMFMFSVSIAASFPTELATANYCYLANLAN